VTLDVWPLNPAHGVHYVIGVDLATKFDSTAIAVCHAETRDGERRVVCDDLEVFELRRGAEVSLADVERRVEQLANRYRSAEVFFDPQNASLMLENLQGRRVDVEEYKFTASSNDRMTNTMHVMLRDGLIDLSDDEPLLDELLTVRVVETRQGGLKVDTVPGRHDDQVDALGICVTTLMDRGVGTGRTGTIFEGLPTQDCQAGDSGSVAGGSFWSRSRWSSRISARRLR
jgi:phage terminase large subunit-like protein